jgi:hypothetical protein
MVAGGAVAGVLAGIGLSLATGFWGWPVVGLIAGIGAGDAVAGGRR